VERILGNPEGLHYIDFNIELICSLSSAGFEFLVVNQWVDLSDSTSGTLSGSEKHLDSHSC